MHPYPKMDTTKALCRQKRKTEITGIESCIQQTDNPRQKTKYLIDKLKPTVDDPKNIEIFYGSLDDKNDLFFYEEAMQILKPYIDSGALVECKPKSQLHTFI